MRGTRYTDRSTRKFITIQDMDLWEKIDQIMTAPTYQKSFNKVINDALYYGLDLLYKNVFELVEEVALENQTVKTVIRDGANEAYFCQIIKLIKEVVLNATINKSILCSLFNLKRVELSKAIDTKFNGGSFKDLPEYLIDYEMRGLQDLRNFSD